MSHFVRNRTAMLLNLEMVNKLLSEVP